MLKDIQHENRKMANKLAELKSSLGIQEIQLNSLMESLSKVTKANNVMKLELQAMREKFNKQKCMTDKLYESPDDLEQCSRKNSLKIHGAPEDLYTSPEDVVIKLSVVVKKWNGVWKIIPNHYFDLYSGLNFLLRCDYDLKFLEQTGMPQFYNSMLQFFQELKFSYETDLGHDLVLFNNKDILIDNKTFCNKSWFKKGIF